VAGLELSDVAAYLYRISIARTPLPLVRSMSLGVLQ